MIKRAFDALCAVVALVILSPLLALICLLVWVDDPGPIMYRGERVGKDGAPFQILKFRTMRVRPIEGAAITVRDDPRVTTAGRILRKLKLDELPQLINVLRGEMSFVGPRPEAPVYVALYQPDQLRVLSVSPGITGLTQIVYRDESQLLAGSDPERLYRTVALPAKLRIDLFYLDHQSFWLDLRIIALTAVTVLYPPASALANRLITPVAATRASAMDTVLEPVLNEPVAHGAKEER
jgi:lipopolysaccharide/colanic/teichoic acid biosynthesis glycosyltransferase